MNTPCRRYSALLVCMAFLLGFKQVRAQADGAGRPDYATPLASDAEGLLKLDVVVTDKSGNPVTTLEPKDFTLLENDHTDKILSFHAFDGVLAKPNPPVEVILVIDTVGMSGGQLLIAEHEVEKFLRQNNGHLAQPVSMFYLSDTGFWVPPQPQPSNDGNSLAASIEHKGRLRAIRKLQNDKDLQYPSAPYASSLRALPFIAAFERQKPGRKLMIWIGPDWGLADGKFIRYHDIFDAIVWFSILMREARIALYDLSVQEPESHAIRDMELIYSWDAGPWPPRYQDLLKGVTTAREANPAHLDTKILAVQSGGRVRDVTKDLTTQINRCVADASAFYMLSFDPLSADHPDEYHDLKVLVGKPGLTAHTNTGYYDQPYYLDQPNPATKRVTVEELGQMLEAAHGSADAELTRQLSDLELTERLSTVKLTAWIATIHDAKARQALVALADASAFLDPPAAEIPTDAPPDAAARRQMLSRTLDYLTKTVPKLPNFFATRTTVLYRETPPDYEGAGKAGVGYQPLHMAGISKTTLLVRDGKEVTDQGATRRKPKAIDPSSIALNTIGTFGPILSTVFLDAAATPQGLTWTRWERSAETPVAVFRFVIPPNKSHYQLVSCCLPDGDGTISFQKLVGYHGEITVDPVTGTILRLTLDADLSQSMPAMRSDIMVEYGSVQIGPNRHTCPIKSVSILRGRSVRVVGEWDARFRTFGPFVTTLNDVAFGDYHMFGVESRVLPGYNRVP